MDFTPAEIDYLLNLAADLKAKKRAGIRGCALAGKNVALLFEKASTRTRCAFTVACVDEGAHPEFLGKNDIHLGGKEDVTVQHLSALVAYLTKRPCKMKLTREESLAVHPKRHPMDMEFTLGCDKDGIIKGLKAKVISDTGAYASLGIPVLQRACTHASGPYNYQNLEIDGYAYYTNNPPAGAFRGFGVTQTCFAIESLLNYMADEVGISHWEIRYRNAIRPGQCLPNGQIVDDSTGLVETLLAVKDEFESHENTGNSRVPSGPTISFNVSTNLFKNSSLCFILTSHSVLAR